MNEKTQDLPPFVGVHGAYFPRELLERARADITRKAPTWLAGLDEPSPCEKLAYELLKEVPGGKGIG